MVIQFALATFPVSTVTWKVSSWPERNLEVLRASPFVSVHAILYLVACGQASLSLYVKVRISPLETSDSFSASYHFSSARVLERYLTHHLWIGKEICVVDELRLNLCHGAGIECYLEGPLCLAAGIGLLGRLAPLFLDAGESH